ncbi:hypothetical protein SAMN05660865_00087 [Caloramator fervidus]|uniref:ATP synthase I chain n=1 Tax=Caloramator fervidus TaxID=29344 RepID=A0A1H5RLM2_9CLOT|nr:hypothetical protein [Caloramator fervidus]SEF39014.1 hypothetical protein SAMN05660865_00087 [Caloramator fervidus]
MIKQKIKFSVFIALFLFILIYFIKKSFAKDFLFGYFLGLFNFFNQIFIINLLFSKKIIKLYYVFFFLKYFIIAFLLFIYIKEFNANVIGIFIGITVIYVSIIIDSIKKGDGNGKCKTIV